MHPIDWTRGPFAIFELGGPVLAVGSSVEEATHRAERALGRDLSALRWNESPLQQGDHYVAPVAGDVAEAIAMGVRFTVPADATPESGGLMVKRRVRVAAATANSPFATEEQILETLRRAIDGALVRVDAFDPPKVALQDACARAAGELLAIATIGAEAPLKGFEEMADAARMAMHRAVAIIERKQREAAPAVTR